MIKKKLIGKYSFLILYYDSLEAENNSLNFDH